jgi:hypothetical protein
MTTATVGTASAAAHPTKQERMQARAASFGFVKALICVGSVGAFVAGNTVLVLKIKKAGGVVKFARALWKAKSAEQRTVLIGKLFGTLTGGGGVIEACTP